MCLQDKHDDPVYAGHNRIQGERCIMMVILAPDSVTSTAFVVAVSWFVEGVICSNNHNEQPCNNGEDLVGDEVAPTELLAFCERVV